MTQIQFGDRRNNLPSIGFNRYAKIKPATIGPNAPATNALNSFADKGDIDMSMVNKLVDIIPMMKDMGNVEVAKAIIAEQNKSTEEKTDKSKSNRGRKPKTKTENIEIVK